MSNVFDGITEQFVKNAVEDGDPAKVEFVIDKMQELLVTMFSLWVLLNAKDHEGHGEDCQVAEAIPKSIANFKRQLLKDIDMHVEMNLVVNGIHLKKTTNQKTYDEIMASLKN